MKIDRLLVHNIRGIRHAEIAEAEEVITIAGSNGCGKSCLVDCIRLFKSQYGSYAANEEALWWQEKQLDVNKRETAQKILRDKSLSGRVEMDISVTPAEKAYIEQDPHQLIERLAISELFPGIRHWPFQDAWNWRSIPELVANEGRIQERTHMLRETLHQQLAAGQYRGVLEIRADGTRAILPHVVLTYIFTTFDPDHLGVIAFHGAERSYDYEHITNVNIAVEESDSVWKNAALYNQSGKYSNIKASLAAETIKGYIAEQAGGSASNAKRITESLERIFNDLIPGKRFRGPTPTVNGELEFNVTIGDVQHDLNDLSSGEKEIALGYLRTIARAPRNSVIIVDEPELHLNPRMIAELPTMYEREIGKALNNQVWLVTHSDAFLRQAFDTTSMAVYHMAPAHERATDSQVTRLSKTSEFDRACVDLIGDLATYQPRRRILLVEGESDFDAKMLRWLFPEEIQTVNLFGHGGKKEVLDAKRHLVAVQARCLFWLLGLSDCRQYC